MENLIKFKLEIDTTNNCLYFTLLDFNSNHPIVNKSKGFCINLKTKKVKKGFDWTEFKLSEDTINIYFSNGNTNLNLQPVSLQSTATNEYQLFCVGITKIGHRCKFIPPFKKDDLNFWIDRIVKSMEILSKYKPIKSNPHFTLYRWRI